MDLHVTLASAPPCAFPAREIVVDTLALPTGAALAARLAAAGYRGPFTVGGAPLTAMTASAGDLTDGAIIVCGSSPPQDDGPPMPHLVFVVRSGPDAGQVVPLRRGCHTIGRAACDIVIADPALSRRHALLTVTGDAVVLEDLASANGTFVDGRRIGTAEVTVSAALRLGGSRCRIELVDDDGWRYVRPADVLVPVRVGREPPGAPSRLLVLTAVLPLVLGIGLAVTTGMWFFLAFSALSAVTGAAPLVVHRRNVRVFAAALRDAAERDRERRLLAVPDPGQTALDALRACRPVPGGPPGAQPAPAEILLRLGVADQPANLTTVRDAAFVRPVLHDLPLVLPCRADRPGATSGPAAVGASGSGGAAGECFTVAGDPTAVRGTLRAMLLQLAHPEQGSPPVICWGSARHLPVHARFLPNVLLTRDPRVLAGIGRQAGVLLVLQVAEDLPEAARRPGTVVVRFRLDGAGGGPATSRTALPAAGMVMAADGARARIDGREYRVLPDGVSERTFERTARALARAARTRPSAAPPTRPGTGDGSGLPSSVSLWSAQSGPDTLASSVPRRWAAADARRPTAFVGRSGTGPVAIDLVRDGPHLLVAGTTGSGKSEFLRTLVLGLALDQSPRHLSLLLIDYKGGSGLGALAGLPHCVGLLTDLSPESTARALTSLRAELRRRELLCAGHGARDLDGLRRVSPSTCPARLVVVIDEFRVLGDAVPTAVPDLMRIAALGRSLGVHLVLATQRVQGAVTPDLRANITTSVLLRVQSAVESQDLLGSGAAAEIPVDAPGRAFLRRGAEAPVAVQVASPSAPPTADRTPGWQDVASYLGETAADASRGEGDGTDDAGGRPREALAEAVAGLAAAARGAAAGRQPRPVLPPLPTLLTPAECGAFRPVGPGSSPAAAVGVPLGIVDLPACQAQHVLRWRPDSHSHLALVGLPGSGVAEALAAVVSSLPRSDPDLHLYVLDGDGTLGRCSADPHVGAYVLPQEARRAGRVLERLAAPGPGGRATGRVVLVLTCWARWSSQFRNGRLARVEDDLQALVRNGAGSGVGVLAGGDRDLTTSRFFPLLPNRVYLPLGAHQETTMTWPAMPPIDAVPGRGFAQGPITGSWGDATCQLLTDPSDPAGAGPPVRPPVRAPFPVRALPREVGLARIAAAGAPDRLVAGVYGDDLLAFSIAVHPGDVYLVLGPRGSGRTNTLRVLAESAGRLIPPRSVLAPPPGAPGPAAPAYWRDIAGGAGPGPLDGYILVVDDADRLPADVQQALAGLVARGAACVLSALPGPALLTRLPLALQARAAGRGLVLAPRTPGDGDFFGARLDTDGEPVAGRGFACDPGGVVEVQIARAPGGSDGSEGIRRPAADDTPGRDVGPYSAFPVAVVRTVYPTTGPEKSVTMTTAAGTRSATPMSGDPVEK